MRNIGYRYCSRGCLHQTRERHQGMMIKLLSAAFILCLKPSVDSLIHMLCLLGVEKVRPKNKWINLPNCGLFYCITRLFQMSHPPFRVSLLSSHWSHDREVDLKILTSDTGMDSKNTYDASTFNCFHRNMHSYYHLCFSLLCGWQSISKVVWGFSAQVLSNLWKHLVLLPVLHLCSHHRTESLHGGKI